VGQSGLNFYTISDARFFLGTVALLNSLHQFGHTETLVILDCGLTETQRRHLEPFAVMVPFDRTKARNPLQKWWAACERIWSNPTLYEGAAHLDSPTSTGDQDALNAVLMSMVPVDAVRVLPAEKAPASSHFEAGVTVTDLPQLRCHFRGVPTLLLHGSGRHKPWDRYGWVLVRYNPYVRLLRWLLTSPNLALRVPSSSVPMWLRDERELPVRALDLANRGIWMIAGQPVVFPIAQKMVRSIRKDRQPPSRAGIIGRVRADHLSPAPPSCDDAEELFISGTLRDQVQFVAVYAAGGV
jgi:hypothetical protein